MRVVFPMAFFLTVFCRAVLAQHCAPIGESYLSELSVKADEKDIKIRGEYRKRGGQDKMKYQLYVLAYLDRDADKVPAPAPAASPDDKKKTEHMGPTLLLDPAHVLILHTQLIERNKDEGYPFEYKIDLRELAERFLKQDLIVKEELSKSDKPGSFRGRLRVAVFIPFLDDTKHATLPGLPEDKHECNYSNAPALLYQQLPYLFRLNSFSNRSMLDINSDQITPSKPK